MRSYEDISKRIMQRGNDILEKRRIKAVKIRHSSYAVSGMCAAVIVGIGVWRISSSGGLGKNSLSGVSVVTENSTEATVKPNDTEKATNNNEKISTVTSVKSCTTTQTVTTKKTTSTDAATTAHISTSFTGVTSPESTAYTTRITTLQQTQITTEIALTTQTTTAVDTLQEVTFPVKGENESGLIDPTAFIDPYITSKFNKIVIGDIRVDGSMNINNFNYIFNTFYIDKRNIGIMTGSSYVTSLTQGTEPEMMFADIYSINGINTNVAVALKYSNKPGYYIYTNPDYKPSSLGNLINDLSLSYTELRNPIRIGKNSYGITDSKKLWDMLTEDIVIEILFELREENSVITEPELSVPYLLSSLDLYSGNICVSLNGEMYWKIGPNTSYYYIGKEKAEEIIEYVKENFPVL